MRTLHKSLKSTEKVLKLFRTGAKLDYVLLFYFFSKYIYIYIKILVGFVGIVSKDLYSTRSPYRHL